MSGLRLGHHVVRADGPVVLPGSSPSIPSDLRVWWSLVERAEVFRDVDHGQWGLQLLSPTEALDATRLGAGERPDMLPTDLIIGQFLGDQETVLMRCDPDALDFGTIVVRSEIESRADWPAVASSFTEFLAYWVATSGDKYWDVSGEAEIPVLTDAPVADVEPRQ